MKNIFLLLLATVFTTNSLLANAPKEIILITGSMNNEYGKSAVLFQVIEGKKVEYARTIITDSKEFAFALPNAREGFYYLSDQTNRNFIRVYLKEGEKLQLKITESKYEVLAGSTENKLLQEWYQLAYPVTFPPTNWAKDTMSYLSYFPLLESLVSKIPVFKTKINTNNQHFNQLMKMAVDADIELASLSFLLSPHTSHPKKEQYPSYFSKIIQPNKYPNASLLELGEAVDLLRRYTLLPLLLGTANPKVENRLLAFANMIANDTLKGAYVASSLNYKSFEALEKDIAPVKQYLYTDSMQAAYFRAVKAVANLKKGSESYNFTYPDHTGKTVSMNDFKGKIVYMDVWATWCGPCKVELPHLKKIEEEYKGKNIEFVSISVDEDKDKAKWAKMINDDQMGGKQLFASGFSRIAKYYDITSIPRFLLFDTDGKIISVDSPRPSNPELKKLLDKTLEGK